MWAVNRATFEEMVTKWAKLAGVADTPEVGSEAWKDWLDAWYIAIEHEGNPLQSQVSLAMALTLAEGVGFWNKVLPAVLKHLRKIRAENPAQPDGEGQADDVASAQAASANCHGCRGSGMMHVWHKRHNASGIVTIRTPEGTMRTIRTEATICCVCQLGRLMLKSRIADPSMAGKFLDAAKLANSEWVLDDPTVKDDDVPEHFNWQAHVRSWAAKTSVSEEPKKTRRSYGPGTEIAPTPNVGSVQRSEEPSTQEENTCPQTNS